MNIWIAGASTGIGAALAKQYAQAGHSVYASARSADKLQALAQEATQLSGQIIPVPCDVTDNESVLAAVADIQKSGAIDIAILNAGYYEPIELEALNLEHFLNTYNVNLTGVVRCFLALLPSMRRSASGQIAIVSSVSGYTGLPRAAAYGSSKAALINLAESLQPECKAAGIDIRLINPGFVKSPLTDKNTFEMPFIIEAEEAASRIIKGLDGKGFEIHFPKRFTLWLKLFRSLPYFIYLKLAARL